MNIKSKTATFIELLIILSVSIGLGFGASAFFKKLSKSNPHEEISDFNLGVEGKVVMYSTSWCPVCKRARTYFKTNNISYIEYDIETTNKGKEDYKKMEGRGVPIFIIGKTKINGFEVSLLKKYLK